MGGGPGQCRRGRKHLFEVGAATIGALRLFGRRGDKNLAEFLAVEAKIIV
jgi:hypothetical protein